MSGIMSRHWYFYLNMLKREKELKNRRKKNERFAKEEMKSQRETPAKPGSLPFLLAERESSNFESMKNPVALLHPWNARRLHRHPLRPGRPLAAPSPGLPSRQEGREVRFSSFCSKRRHRLPGESPRVPHFAVRNSPLDQHEVVVGRYFSNIDIRAFNI